MESYTILWQEVFDMDMFLLEKKVESLLKDLKSCLESQNLTEHDACLIKAEIDKILYECMYYRTKLIS